MSGRVSDKTAIDNRRVWDLYWKYYKEAGEMAKKIHRSHFEELVGIEIGYEPKTVRRKINQMLKKRPSPCF